jgi:hypothetical protein
MRITKVTVGLSSNFNHPYEQYANFKPHVSLEAEVAEGEDVNSVVYGLQSEARILLQLEKKFILESLKIEHDEDVARREVEYQERVRAKRLERGLCPDCGGYPEHCECPGVLAVTPTETVACDIDPNLEIPF